MTHESYGEHEQDWNFVNGSHFPPKIVAANMAWPANSGVLSKLVIDDSLTERKLSSHA